MLAMGDGRVGQDEARRITAPAHPVRLVATALAGLLARGLGMNAPSRSGIDQWTMRSTIRLQLRGQLRLDRADPDAPHSLFTAQLSPRDTKAS